MRIIIALGGNALLKRGETMDTETQRRNVAIAAAPLARVAEKHQLVVTHGNGPQVGLLALQTSENPKAWPLDVLGAQTEGMIGYLIEQEMGNVLPDRRYATLLSQVEVDPNDPAFDNPTKFIGPIYSKDEAEKLAAENKWSIAQDGDHWRRVVASPLPKRIFETKTIEILLENEAIVICTGGGGIPTAYNENRQLRGVEAVIDKDRAAALLALELKADMYIMLTDVEGVFENWGTDEQRLISKTTPDELEAKNFAAGSMGPKVEAACDFVRKTGNKAVIGALDQLDDIIKGKAGTLVQPA